jgi:hypothetical protein
MVGSIPRLSKQAMERNLRIQPMILKHTPAQSRYTQSTAKFSHQTNYESTLSVSFCAKTNDYIINDVSIIVKTALIGGRAIASKLEMG